MPHLYLDSNQVTSDVINAIKYDTASTTPGSLVLSWTAAGHELNPDPFLDPTAPQTQAAFIYTNAFFIGPPPAYSSVTNPSETFTATIPDDAFPSDGLLTYTSTVHVTINLRQTQIRLPLRILSRLLFFAPQSGPAVVPVSDADGGTLFVANTTAEPSLLEKIQADYLGITRTVLPLDQATVEVNAINTGTTTETAYVDSLLAQVADTTFPAVAVEGTMSARSDPQPRLPT